MTCCKIMLLCFLLGLAIWGGTSCKKEQNNIYAISIFFNYWDGNQFFFISSNENNIDSAFYRDSILKENIPSVWLTEFYNYHNPNVKCILHPDAYKYYIKYFNMDCTDIKLNVSTPIPTFTIHLYSENGDKICFYYYGEQLIGYFKGMILYMIESPYKRDYKIIINQIQQYIDNYHYYKHL